MQRSDFSYEHIDPAEVGNITKVIISEQSGISNILDWLTKHNFDLNVDDETKKDFAKQILTQVKDQEHKGYTYENADASLVLLARKLAAKLDLKTTNHAYYNYFSLLENNVHILNGEKTEATVRIKIGDEIKHSASLGDGPANALDLALRKALRDHYPQVDAFGLNDYKVRIQDSQLGTAAITKVQVSTGNKQQSWDTIGVSNNIIKASWEAIVDSIQYGLQLYAVKPVN
jgi:2-isopropylmalate synthase